MTSTLGTISSLEFPREQVPPRAMTLRKTMAALAAITVGLAVLGLLAYDGSRLVTTQESRRPPLARLRGRRAALEAAERWLVGLRLHGRVDARTYRARMSWIARGRRRSP